MRSACESLFLYIKYECIELRNALDCLGKHAHDQTLYERSFSKSDYVRSKIFKNLDFLEKLIEND